MRGRRQRASSPMPSSLLPCLAVRKGLSQPLTVRRPFLIARSQQHLQERVAILPEIHPPRKIGVHGALVPSHFSIKYRPLSARSGCWAARPRYLDALSPVMLLPTIMTIICLDTCQAFSRPSRPPPVLHLHSAHSLLAHCSLTRSPHSSTLPHWPQAPPMPPQRSARPCGRTYSAQRSARPCGRSPPPQASGTGGARRATTYTNG